MGWGSAVAQLGVRRSPPPLASGGVGRRRAASGAGVRAPLRSPHSWPPWRGVAGVGRSGRGGAPVVVQQHAVLGLDVWDGIEPALHGAGPQRQRDLGHLLPVRELWRQVDGRARLEVGEGVDEVHRRRREPLEARQKAGQLSTRAGSGESTAGSGESTAAAWRPELLPRPAMQGPLHRVRERKRQLWVGVPASRCP